MQADTLGQRLAPADMKIDTILTSPLQRARQTSYRKFSRVGKAHDRQGSRQRALSVSGVARLLTSDQARPGQPGTGRRACTHYTWRTLFPAAVRVVLSPPSGAMPWVTAHLRRILSGVRPSTTAASPAIPTF